METDKGRTYYAQNTDFEGTDAEGATIEVVRRERIGGRRRFLEEKAQLLERSGPIQIGPSEAMYIEYGLIRRDDGGLGIAYQAKDALARWSGWELSEELGALDVAQGVDRLKQTVSATDHFSAAGRGSQSPDF